MDLGIQEKFDFLLSTLKSMDIATALLFLAFFLCIWFLPTILALFFNRQHSGKIFLANIPAGVSWAVWAALIVWAFTGKITATKNKSFSPKENEEAGK